MLAACGSAPPAPEQKQEAAANPAAATVPTEAPLPPEAVQQFDQAVVHMSAGDSAAAEREFRALATAYPTYSGPLLNLGILQVKAGRLEDAEKSLSGAVERNAGNAQAFNQLGIVYRKLGRFKDADGAYQKAVQIDPSYAIAYLNLGVLCDLYLQQPQRALEAYERYLTLAGAPDEKVSGWVTEIKKRLGSEPRAARAE
ncbi:MAG TPA: tetratricopeptide repeat protein [Steroidobacteraceae bacterium]|nr:tetratricopeptide repeat protein [Steroidobacteraceae bacterium]